MKKRYLIALATYIADTYKLQNNPSHYFKFNIDKIYIENNLIIIKKNNR